MAGRFIKRLNIKTLIITQLIAITFFPGCKGNRKNNFQGRKRIESNDSIFMKKDYPKKTKQIKSKKKQSTKRSNTKIKLKPYYDYHSETVIYYESYIGKAYSDKIYRKYFETNREILDSLINKFENTKSNGDKP